MERAAPRVLVVDDSPDTRDTMRAILEAEGFEVALAENGEQALRVQRERPARVVVTDLFMPEKDGIETMHELHTEFPDTHIIVISGSDMSRLSNLMVVARELGCEKVLRKPCDPAELVQAVKALVR